MYYSGKIGLCFVIRLRPLPFLKQHYRMSLEIVNTPRTVQRCRGAIQHAFSRSGPSNPFAKLFRPNSNRFYSDANRFSPVLFTGSCVKRSPQAVICAASGQIHRSMASNLRFMEIQFFLYQSFLQRARYGKVL